VRDLDRLPDDGQRYELIDGVVTVAPSPTVLHQYVASRLEWQLATAAPVGSLVVQAVGVVLAEDQCPIPDILVLHRQVDSQLNRILAADVAIAVEVVSPSTRSTDRFRKPSQYGIAGIPWFWRVELDPIQVIAYRLGSHGEYVEVAQAGSGQRFAAAEPFPVECDPAELLP
jgi:Uma2 family endonuclease